MKRPGCVCGAKAALDVVVDYAQNRFAFRRAIGLFQAIKHKLVNIYVDSSWRVRTLITAPGR